MIDFRARSELRLADGLPSRSCARNLLMALCATQFLFCGSAARPETAPATLSRPILRIEAGTHGADITGLATDRSGTLLATGSFDKTARLWRLDQLDAGPKVFRVPIDDQSREGALYAVALSPDGKTLVAAGWTGAAGPLWSAYVFDTTSGQLTRRLADLPHRAVSLAYSHDGASLAIGMKAGKGVMVRRTDDWSIVMHDESYSDDIPSLQFGPSGELAAASRDGSITLYRNRLSQKTRIQDAGGAQPAAVRVSPDGQLIAVGHSQDARVTILNGNDLTTRVTLEARNVHGGLTALEWSKDGRFLFGAGQYERGGLVAVRRWTIDEAGEPRDFPAGQGFITHLRLLSGGRLAFATTQGTLGILDDGGRPWWVKRFPGADFRDQQERLRISGDGSEVEFSFERLGMRTARFSLPGKSLSTDVAPDSRLVEPLISAPGLAVRDWRESKAPTLNGKPIALMPEETATSVAIARDAQRFVLGTAWRVIGFDRQGKQLWSKDAPSAAWALNVTSDGEIAVGAFGDGTIRWLRMSDGHELLSLFAVEDQRRWVAWVPSGFYVASVGGDRLIGWHVNRGADQAADFFAVSRLRATFNNPEVVGQVLATRGYPLSARGTRAPSQEADSDINIKDVLPPVVEITAPVSGQSFTSARMKLTYTLRSRPADRPTRILVRADGRPVGEFLEPPSASPGAITRDVELELPRRDHVLEVLAEGEAGTYSEPATAYLNWKGDAAGSRPRLFVLAIGIDQYRSAELQLAYSVKDTDDLISAFRQGEPDTYRSVSVRQLTNDAANLNAIRSSLDWIAGSAGPDDVAVVFLSGHGFQNRAGHYYYVPVDVSEADVFSRGLSDGEIRHALSKIGGRVILFLDTCRSAAAWSYSGMPMQDIGRLINDLSSPEIGVFVFASSSSNQESFESPEWRNGAFTKAIVEGLHGKADLFQQGRVTVTGLDAYVSHRVSVLTRGRQTPATGKPVARDFALMRLRQN